MAVAWDCVQREALVLSGVVLYIIQIFNLYQVTHYCKIKTLFKKCGFVYFQTALSAWHALTMLFVLVSHQNIKMWKPCVVCLRIAVNHQVQNASKASEKMSTH